MEIEVEPETPLSPKEVLKHRIKEKMLQYPLRKTKTQIAKELEISRPTLNKYLKEIDYKELLEIEIEALKEELMPMLLEMLRDPDGKLTKGGADNIMKLILKLEDKSRPDLNQNQNININIDLTRLQLEQEIHDVTVSRLPPNHRQIFLETEKQVRKELTP